MYYDLMNMAKMRCCTPYVSPEDYDRMVRFTESAIADDKWDIINKFLQLGNRVLGSGEINHIGPGEKSQYRPDENRQSRVASPPAVLFTRPVVGQPVSW